jgi:multicomponent Na+:H+ antiporter subunit E
MLITALLAVPMAIIWMILTNSVTPASFSVGYILGVAVVMMLKLEHVAIDHRRLPDQIVALVIYVVTLCRDIWNSSIDVAKRVLNPNLPLNPGIITISTQDESASDLVAAFSAHGITITPGELVVDFDGSHAMYVHCLDVEASSQSGDAAQTKRLKLMHRIMGKDV